MNKFIFACLTVFSLSAADVPVKTFELNDGQRINAVRSIAFETNGEKTYTLTTITGRTVTVKSADIKELVDNLDFADALADRASYPPKLEKLKREHAQLTADKENMEKILATHQKRLDALRAQRDAASTNEILNEIEAQRNGVAAATAELKTIDRRLADNSAALAECNECIAYFALADSKAPAPAGANPFAGTASTTAAADKPKGAEEWQKDYLQLKSKWTAERETAARLLAAARTRLAEVERAIDTQTNHKAANGVSNASPELRAEQRDLPGKIEALERRHGRATTNLNKVERRWKAMNTAPIPGDPFRGLR